jgi:hypothetical protein
MKITILTTLPGILSVLLTGQIFAVEPGTCVSDEEAQLMQLVNDYRAENGETRVAWSKSLGTVAQWHILDATTNSDSVFTPDCNLHSWSDWKPAIWKDVCYTEDHANASLMWSKPKEITKNVYPAAGFEVAGSGYLSVDAVLAGWQNSPGHNDVLLSQGIWADYPFKAMGAGVDPVLRFYYLWFSTGVDPQGEMPLCKPSVFINGFE